MKQISVLDCTLRDGGWVNGFEFGNTLMRGVVDADIQAGLEYMELGYIDRQKGSRFGRSCYADMESIDENGLVDKRIKQFVMYDLGKFSAKDLPEKSEHMVDGIRLCFHKKNLDTALEEACAIMAKGYELFFQPMVNTRYSDEEFTDLITRSQTIIKGLKGIYVVDSFGVMTKEDILNRLKLADRIMNRDLILGIHVHNNIQLAFRHAADALDLHLDRELVVDATLLGMGKGAGNLNLTDYLSYLNTNHEKTYDLSKINQVIERAIRPLQNEFTWGYSEEYSLSAKYIVTPSYAEFFYRKKQLDMDEMEILLSRIPDKNKDSFSPEVAENLYLEFIQETAI